MLKPFVALAASSLLIFGSSNALAQQQVITFRLVSQLSGKCISLQAPDQDDGGGLTMGDCQNLPEFLVTAICRGLTSQVLFQSQGCSPTPLQFRLRTDPLKKYLAGLIHRSCEGENGASGPHRSDRRKIRLSDGGRDL